MQIIGMFQARNENAIKETAVKYGRLLYSIAFNLLSNHEDSEEIVNDTYEKAWNTIPPQCPELSQCISW
ncbi:MAG: RNA polymerase sigma factor [Caldicoprobacterales bacterium]